MNLINTFHISFGKNFLMKQTNMETQRKLTTKGTNITRSSRLRKWKHASRKEKLAFLGPNIDVIKKKNKDEEYWNTKEFSQSTNIFHQFLHLRDRFFIPHLMLHFPQLDGNLSMLEARGIIYHFNELFHTYYSLNICQYWWNTNSFWVTCNCSPVHPIKHHHRFVFKLFCLSGSDTGY